MRKLVYILRRALFKEASRLTFRSFVRTSVEKNGQKVFLKHKASEEDLKEFLLAFCKEESLNIGTRIISLAKYKQKTFYMIAYQLEEEKIEIDLFLGQGAELRAGFEWMEREFIKGNGAEESYYKRLERSESIDTVEDVMKGVPEASTDQEAGWHFNKSTLEKEQQRLSEEKEIAEKRNRLEEQRIERLEAEQEAQVLASSDATSSLNEPAFSPPEPANEEVPQEEDKIEATDSLEKEQPQEEVNFTDEQNENTKEEQIEESDEASELNHQEEMSFQEGSDTEEENAEDTLETEEKSEEEVNFTEEEVSEEVDSKEEDTGGEADSDELNFAQEESPEDLSDEVKEEEKVSEKEDKSLESAEENLEDMFGGGADFSEEEETQEQEPASEQTFIEEEIDAESMASEEELESPSAPASEPSKTSEVSAPVVPPVAAQAPSASSAQVTKPGKINYSNDLDGVGGLGGKHGIDSVLVQMVNKGASDLHLTIDQPVVFRIDGEIQRQEGKKLTPALMESYVDSIIPKGKRAEFIETSDIDFAHEVKGKGRFRVNLYRDTNGVACVIRHIPDKIISAKDLNLPEALIRFCHASKGLVLVTGPTGSGKSTTLAALLDYINETRAEHILTIEDPIEFVYEQKKCLVNQREVSKHTDSFHSALRASLREDPDIILVGELRDLETTSHAVELAETGHLVFATLHTNTAIATIDRIIDMYPPEQQNSIRNVLAANVRGVASQVLCKKIEGGRVAGLEVLVMDEAVSSLIRENKIHMVENHLKTHREAGNALMADALLDLVEKQLITYEEAWAKATNKKSFEAQAERRNIKKT